MKKIIYDRRKSSDIKSQINALKFLHMPKFSMKMKKIKSFDSQLTADGDLL